VKNPHWGVSTSCRTRKETSGGRSTYGFGELSRKQGGGRTVSGEKGDADEIEG